MISKELHWDDFALPQREEWNNEFAKSLKGLIPFYEVEEGLKLSPLYTREESGHNHGRPGEAPFVRGIRILGNDWTSLEYLATVDPRLANKQALEALGEGIGGLRMLCGNHQPEMLQSLLEGIHLPYIQAEFVVSSRFSDWLQVISSFSGEPGPNPGLGIFLLDSSDYEGFSSLSKELRSIQGTVALPRFARIDATEIANRGAGMVSRLTLALASGHELFVRMLQAGFSPDDAGAYIQADMAIGPDFLSEISALRAFRRLWAEVVAKYSPVHACSAGIRIHTETAIWNISVTDRYTNLIRATSAAMAAVLGNCDSHAVMPYDLVSQPADPNSAHTARSIRFLLKDESFFNRVGDPAGGSYFMEELTEALCEAAWKGFQELENAGGIASVKGKALAGEWISRDSDYLRQAHLSGKRSWIGVNRFPPGNEERLEARATGSMRMELEAELKHNGR